MTEFDVAFIAHGMGAADVVVPVRSGSILPAVALDFAGTDPDTDSVVLCRIVLTPSAIPEMISRLAAIQDRRRPDDLHERSRSTPTAEEELWVDISDALADLRAGCWCTATRKRCEYHAGAEIGAEVTMATIYDASAATVSTWLAGG